MCLLALFTLCTLVFSQLQLLEVTFLLLESDMNLQVTPSYTHRRLLPSRTARHAAAYQCVHGVSYRVGGGRCV